MRVEIPATSSRPKARFWLAAGFIVFVILVLAFTYGRNLNHQFLSDDFWFLRLSSTMSFTDVLQNFSRPTSLYRPVIFLICYLNFHLTGWSPIAWHGVNLLLHVINCLLGYWLVVRLTHRPALALLSAGLYSIHFIHSEAISWMSGRTALIVTTFTLLTLLIYLRYARRKTLLSGFTTGFLLLAALSSKEEALMVVPVMAVLDFWRRDRFHWRSSLLSIFPFTLIAVASFLYRLPALLAVDSTAAYVPVIGLHILKNYLFLFTGSLVDLDFRHLLEIWNAFRDSHNFSQLLTQITRMGVIPAIIVVMFLYILLWWRGGKAVRLMLLWAILFFLPGSLLKGTGERILYLPLFGLVTAWVTFLLPLLRKFWSTARTQRLAAGTVLALFLLWVGYNVFRLHTRVGCWEKAGAISENVIQTIDRMQSNWPPGTTVLALDILDNYEGAWVFRMGFEQLPYLFWPTKHFSFAKADSNSLSQLIRENKNFGRPVRVLRYTNETVVEVTAAR